MTAGEVGIELAFAGLGGSLSWIQIQRNASVAVLLVAGAIWRIALLLHWWTFLAFVGTFIVIGVFNGIWLRRNGLAWLYSMRFYCAAMGLVCVPLSWLLR